MIREGIGRLIDERRAQAGTLVGNSRQPFDFAQWVQGVNDGWNPKDGPRQGMIL